MQLENLDLLEEKIIYIARNYKELKEEIAVLERRLEGNAHRATELDDEVQKLRLERDVIRERLNRLSGLVEELERIEAQEGGDN